MRNWINSVLVEDQSNELDKARALMRSGRKVLFHSGLAEEAADIGRHGLEPNNEGAWIKEIAYGAFDDQDDAEEALSKTVPIVWMSSDPSWVNIKAQRSSGASAGKASADIVVQHAHLALVDAEDYADEIFYVGDEGLSNGAYSTVWDVHGQALKFYDTDLYAYDDASGGHIEPFGIERNEWISAAYIDVAANLVGEDVLTFLKEFYPDMLSRALGA